MRCEHARDQLTSYLDGELDGDRGSALRGHLRGCEPCRVVARDEAALRDGLRALPPLDPPVSLWAGVQARLATAEMADAQKPTWRRTLGRWAAQAIRPRYGALGLGVAAAIAILAWRFHHQPNDPAAITHLAQASGPRSPAFAGSLHLGPANVLPVPAPVPGGITDLDVTADLASDAARSSQDYVAATAELLHDAEEARLQWPDDRKVAFDAHIVDLRHTIDTADEGSQRHKAYRALIRYLERAAILDEVAMTDMGGTR